MQSCELICCRMAGPATLTCYGNKRKNEMTVPEKKKILRKWLMAMQAGDLQAIQSLQTKDCTWVLPGSKKLPWAGSWTGMARQKLFLKQIKNSVEFEKLEFREFIGEGAHITILGQEVARSKTRGKRWNVTFSWVFKIKRGKVARWEAFENTEIIASCF